MLSLSLKNTTVNETSNELVIKHMGLQEYGPMLQQLKQFTHNRTTQTPDEIWLLQHLPVFTQGQAGKAEHLLNPANIPVVQSDRGGQITYHGPGQLIVYCLIDIQRKNLNTRQFVTLLEDCVIELLALYGIVARGDRDAPGVYIDKAKICSIGLRVRHGRTYHGLSLNVDMDLDPFKRINPCGYAGMQVVQLRDYVPGITLEIVSQQILAILYSKLYSKPFGFRATSICDQ
jgi:lipoyl(octanoyl) transferase